MPRPKGSKNKAKISEPVEFDYEQHGGDASYTKFVLGNEVQNGPPPGFVESEYTPAVNAPVMTTPQWISPERAEILYLIEGRVMLQRQDQNPVYSDQKRLVWAVSFEQAVQKFNLHFTSLSNMTDTYTVINAMGSESIS